MAVGYVLVPYPLGFVDAESLSVVPASRVEDVVADVDHERMRRTAREERPGRLRHREVRCVRTVAEQFASFQKMIPWIAFVLLGFIGGKMVLEGIRHPAEEEEEEIRLAGGTLLLQGVATSIDALSVGFTIASYGVMKALTASALIGLTTLVICLAGLRIGRYFGMRLAGKASVLGGVILIAIGIRILAGGL